MKNTIVIKTLFGLENLLADEIKYIGANNIIIGKRSVTCEADNELIYKINLHSRFGIRVLKLIDSQIVRNENDLYEFIKRIEWEKIFKKHDTFAIDSTVHSDNF